MILTAMLALISAAEPGEARRLVEMAKNRTLADGSRLIDAIRYAAHERPPRVFRMRSITTGSAQGQTYVIICFEIGRSRVQTASCPVRYVVENGSLRTESGSEAERALEGGREAFLAYVDEEYTRFH